MITEQTIPEGCLIVKKAIIFPYKFTVSVRVGRDGVLYGLGVSWGDVSPQREKQIRHAKRAAVELISEGREDYQSASEVLAELPDSPSLSATMAIIAFVAAVEREAWACFSPMATKAWGAKSGGGRNA